MTRKADLPRVKHLREKHGLSLFNLTPYAGVPYFRLVKHEHAAFDHALAMDPTAKAVYLETVIRWLRTRAIRHEDARQVRDVLTAFHRRKHRLPLEQRDIGRYQTPGDLSQAMGLLAKPVLDKIPDDILALAPSVADGNGWAIFRIEETTAATWWASSTNWCTRHPTTALQYLNVGYLFIVVTSDGKWQFHPALGQWMDRYDRPLLDLSCWPEDCIEAVRTLLSELPGYRPAVLERLLAKHRPEAQDLPGMLGTIDELGRWEAMRDDRAPTPRNIDHRTWTSNAGDVLHFLDDRCAIWPSSVDEVQTLGLDDLPAALDADTSIYRFLMDAMALGERGRAEGHAGSVIALPTFTTSMGVTVLRSKSKRGSTSVLAILKDSTNAPGLLILLDPGKRVAVLRGRQDLALSAQWARHAVDSILLEHGRGWALLPFVDPHAVGSEVIDQWRTNRRRRSVVSEMIDRQKLPELSTMIALSFGDRDVDGILRLARSVAGNDHSIWATGADDIPHASDVEELIDVVGAGELVAGLPDERITDWLVDRFIDAGRTEVMGVVPARFVTAERLRRAARIGGETALCRISNRVLSLRVRDTVRSLGPLAGIDTLRRKIEDLVDLKAAPLFGSAFDLLECPPLGTDEWHDVSNHHFHETPPVAMPWNFALQALSHSSVGVHDVLQSLREGGWRMPGRTFRDMMADLHAIPSLRSVIDAPKTRSAR